MIRLSASVFLFLLAVTVLAGGGLGAGEFTDGRIRLILHEDTGRFSLYYQSDPSRESFDPFFTDEDPRTSFIGLIINDKSYRLGESLAFRFRPAEEGADPAFYFESAFLQVMEEFVFIKTAGSSQTNGIQITVTLENRGPQELNLGLRFLIDTSLGERIHGRPPFFTDQRPIESETLIGPKDDDQRWISGNDRYSLMGSIAGPEGQRPDLIHFANWKRLNEASWKIGYSPGRNFNYLPYSIGDSAVCYYFEPRPLARGETFHYIILLAAEDAEGFTVPAARGRSQPVRETVPLPAAAPSPADTKQADMALLREMNSRIARYIAGEINLTEEELADMEAAIARIKVRYNLP
jgi:hypothetical protein